jgi:hypothetical protein
VAAAPATAPTTVEEIDAVVKPLVESAEGALDSAASKALSLAGDALGVVGMVLLTPEKAGGGQGDVPTANDKLCCDENGHDVTPATAAGGAGARQGGGSIDGFTKHGLNQAISRDGVGVSNRAMLDAVKNPTQVVQQSGGRTMYVAISCAFQSRLLTGECGASGTVGGDVVALPEIVEGEGS